jgi:predicted acylesterase/phospholipase RssA
MSTTLRLGLAMGGGVSLGTFSGVALTQALKLLLVRGTDRRGEPYGKLEVDIFSGASAGSMALSLMLRGLVDPDPGREAAAEDRLVREFGPEFVQLEPEVKKALVVAQILQDVQEEVWVREVNLSRLLAKEAVGGVPAHNPNALKLPWARRPAGRQDGVPAAQYRLRHAAGLLDRGAVEALARRYLAFPGAVDLSRRQILAQRVLVACSLANLTPILADATREYPVGELGVLGLSDGLASRVHREVRVFDLHFEPVEAQALTDSNGFPRRWCRYHAGPKVVDEDGTGVGIGSLFEHRVWAKMAATSLASGAYPLVFEPVPLERRSYEYGSTEGGDASLWPEALRGEDRHVFTYVDGGTFLNEPVREAFRLASYIDAQNPEEDFERLILFVDPHVVVPEPDLALPHHGEWTAVGSSPLLRWLRSRGPGRKTSLDRLLPLSRTVGQAILNESRVVEADKVFQTRKRFELRHRIREDLDRALDRHPPLSVLESLARELGALLAKDRVGVMIPAGALTLEGELRRVLGEERGQGGGSPWREGSPPGLLKALRRKTPEDVRAFLASPRPSRRRSSGTGFGPSPSPPWTGSWTWRVRWSGADSWPSHRPGTRPSPGSFWSSREPEWEASGDSCRSWRESTKWRWPGTAPSCSCRRMVRYDGSPCRTCPTSQGWRHSTSGRSVRVLGRWRTAWPGSWRRVPWDFAGSFLPRFFTESSGQPWQAGSIIWLRRGGPTTWELRLQVPDMSFRLRGGHLGERPLRPREVGGKLFLITFASSTGGEAFTWAGTHLFPDQETLTVDRKRWISLPARRHCSVALPHPGTLKGPAASTTPSLWPWCKNPTGERKSLSNVGSLWTKSVGWRRRSWDEAGRDARSAATAAPPGGTGTDAPREAGASPPPASGPPPGLAPAGGRGPLAPVPPLAHGPSGAKS